MEDFVKHLIEIQEYSVQNERTKFKLDMHSGINLDKYKPLSVNAGKIIEFTYNQEKKKKHLGYNFCFRSDQIRSGFGDER